MRSFRLLPLALFLSFGIPACSSDSDDADTNTATKGETPGTATAEITAEDGGEVKLGAATLSIPGGALEGDTTVTVESTKPDSSLPDSSSVSGLVYDFGPDGTTFSEPVELTLPLSATPGKGKEAVVAYLDEETNTWQDLETEAAKDGSVTAEVTHFSKFVVRIRNTNVDMGNGEVECTFDPCGGDPTGTWQLANACVTSEGGDDLFDGKCPEASIGIDIAADGSLTVGDGTYDWSLTLGGNAIVNIPASCVTTIGGGNIKACSEILGDDDDETTCTGTPSTGCVCSKPVEPKLEVSTGTIEISGSKLTATAEGEEPGTPSDFCVKGNSLKLMIHDDDGEDGTTKDTMLSFTR